MPRFNSAPNSSPRSFNTAPSTAPDVHPDVMRDPLAEGHDGEVLPAMPEIDTSPEATGSRDALKGSRKFKNFVTEGVQGALHAVDRVDGFRKDQTIGYSKVIEKDDSGNIVKDADGNEVVLRNEKSGLKGVLIERKEAKIQKKFDRADRLGKNAPLKIMKEHYAKKAVRRGIGLEHAKGDVETLKAERDKEDIHRPERHFSREEILAKKLIERLIKQKIATEEKKRKRNLEKEKNPSTSPVERNILAVERVLGGDMETFKKILKKKMTSLLQAKLAIIKEEIKSSYEF